MGTPTSEAESIFSTPKTEMTEDERLTLVENRVMSIEHNCEKHEMFLKKTTEKVFDEILILKQGFEDLQATIQEFLALKDIIKGMSMILSKRNSILPNGAKTGLKDINWASIIKYALYLAGLFAAGAAGSGSIQLPQ